MSAKKIQIGIFSGLVLAGSPSFAFSLMLNMPATSPFLLRPNRPVASPWRAVDPAAGEEISPAGSAQGQRVRAVFVPLAAPAGKMVIEVFDALQVDRPPQVKSRTTPLYPYAMRRAGVTGQVVVEFIVDHAGDVRDATIARSSRPEFEAPALAAVSQWKFTPGVKGGREVDTRMQVSIVFALNPSQPPAKK